MINLAFIKSLAKTNKVYVGQTGCNLAARIVEHKRSVRYGQENSALFNMCIM